MAPFTDAYRYAQPILRKYRKAEKCSAFRRMIFMQTPAGSVVTVAQAALQLAIEHYGAARHAEAEAVCRQILELAPGDWESVIERVSGELLAL